LITAGVQTIGAASPGKEKQMAKEFQIQPVRELFQELGFPSAGGWDAKRLESKIKNLENIVDEDGVELESDDSIGLFNDIMEAVESGEEILIVGPDKEEEEEEVEEEEVEEEEVEESEPAPKKAAAKPAKKKAEKEKAPAKEKPAKADNGKGKEMGKKKPAKKKAAKKPPTKAKSKKKLSKAEAKAKRNAAKPTKEKAAAKPTKKKATKKTAKKGKKKAAKKSGGPIGTDKFGNRLGTVAAAFNAALGKKPKTMNQILEEINHNSTIYNHANKLIEAGHIKKTDEGYVLK